MEDKAVRNIAILGNGARELMPNNPSIETIDLHGVPVTCGIVSTNEPSFDRGSEKDRFNVLVKMKGFSCNYRDTSLILTASVKGAKNAFYTIGSDFVGEVLGVGAEVSGLAAGDRVIGDYAYLGAQYLNPSVRPGVTTNHASTEYQVLNSAKVIKVSAQMPDEVAAAFTVNAQTAYSMIRKLEVKEGANVLVTAARSHTSLFAINALRKHKVNVYALTTSAGYEERFAELGVKEVLRFDTSHPTLLHDPHIARTAAEIGGFNYVIDPFFDIYLPKVTTVMTPGGRYISCGLWAQYQHLTGENVEQNGNILHQTIGHAMTNNLQILFNCLGGTDDLKQAIDDYSAGHLNVVIDSVHSGNQVGAFLSRTYTVSDRFGKVVYLYS
jgi:NADPH:quinone reductase-like Zn-dependent oxidoreductase